jgi:hypothetical protein
VAALWRGAPMKRIVNPYDINEPFARERKIMALEREVKQLRRDFDRKQMTLVALFLKALEKLGGSMTVTREEFVGIHERLFIKVTANPDMTATYELTTEQPEEGKLADAEAARAARE